MIQELTLRFIDLSHYLIYHFDLSIYNYYLLSLLCQKLIMKIIQSIQNFATKAFRRLLGFVVPSPNKKTAKDASRAHCGQAKKKRSKRCLNFNSFLAKNYSISQSRSLRKQRKIRKLSFVSKIIYHDNSINSQNLNPAEEISLKNEIIHNQAVEVATGLEIYDEIKFRDNYGFQISAIECKENRTHQLNYSSESDPEILKFLFGDQRQDQENKAQRQLDWEQKWREQNQIADQYWWVQPLQQQRDQIKNPQKDSNSSEISMQSQKASSFSLRRRQKSKKIKHSQKNPSQPKTKKVKTILIDENEKKMVKPYQSRLTNGLAF